MGLSIGSIGRIASAPAPPAPPPIILRQREPDRSIQPRLPETATPEARNRSTRPENAPPALPRAGFGRETLSPPGAALETLGRGVRNARATVPTLADQRESIRERVDALRELQEGRDSAATEAEDERTTAAEDSAPVPPANPNVALEIADARARAVTRTQSFVNQVNAAAGTALQRTAPPAPDEREQQAVGGTVFTFARRETSPVPQLIDIRI